VGTVNKTQLLEAGFKAALGFGSLSLGVNSWFIQSRVAEVTESIKALNQRMLDVQIQTAETRSHVIVHDRMLVDTQDRLQGMEAIVNRLTGKLENN
jgi:hypothetical protein